MKRRPDPVLLRQRYGGGVSNVVSDPSCAIFTVEGIEGIIAYRRGPGAHVALGEPLADSAARLALAERFRESRAERGISTIFACTGEALSESLAAEGHALVEFGEQLIVDPRRDPQAGRGGRELRKKVRRSQREGVVVTEYRPDREGPELVGEMERVANGWQRARRGLQTFVAPVVLFPDAIGRRWFYARCRGEMVGVLSLVRVEQGWLFEHLLADPEAPPGTSEAMIAEALARLGTDGVSWSTFGPAPRSQLGRLSGIEGRSEMLVRAMFDMAERLFGFSARTRYRRKFQPVAIEPSFLLFHPRFGLSEARALLGAFNLSLPALDRLGLTSVRDVAPESDAPPSSRAA